MNLSFNFKKELERTENIGRGFSSAPHRYWGYALVSLLILTIASLGFDAYIFWSYVMRLDAEGIEPQVNVESLNRANFDKIKGSIAEKETNFKEATVKTLPRDIFVPAPASISQLAEPLAN